MIILIREERKFYSLVEINEAITMQLKNNYGVKFEKLDTKYMTLSDFVLKFLPKLPVTKANNEDEIDIMAIDSTPNGEIYLYRAYLTTKQLFFVFDNACDDVLGNIEIILGHLKSRREKKLAAG